MYHNVYVMVVPVGDLFVNVKLVRDDWRMVVSKIENKPVVKNDLCSRMY
jgi:hypothetical protein